MELIDILDSEAVLVGGEQLPGPGMVIGFRAGVPGRGSAAHPLASFVFPRNPP